MTKQELPNTKCSTCINKNMQMHPLPFGGHWCYLGFCIKQLGSESLGHLLKVE